jgi:hypothetical protein
MRNLPTKKKGVIMGREIKRVAADFTWELHRVWEGYLNPWSRFGKSCAFCEGEGYNSATKQISDTWYDLDNPTRADKWCDKITQDEVQALVDANRLMDFTHVWDKEKGWQKKDPPYVPTAEEVNALERWKILGHDAMNRWICVEARARRLGVWGKCEFCKGEGTLWLTPAYKKKYEKWKKQEPPKGDYYQIWETVSEGSPITPAFATPEELASYVAKHNWGVDEGISYKEWLAFIKGPGWAPSFVGQAGSLETGVRGSF